MPKTMTKPKSKSIECPACKGKKTVKQDVTEHGPDGIKKYSFMMNCFTCKGKGVLTEAQRLAIEEEDKLWCRCEESSEDVRFQDNGTCDCGVHKHHYHCTNRGCGKISQIG